MSRFQKSWRTSESWSLAHRLISFAQLDPLPDDRKPPIHDKNAKVPRLRQRDFHVFLVPKVITPILIQAAYYQYFKTNPHVLGVFFLYFIHFQLVGKATVDFWKRVGAKYGYLNGVKPRDEIPDSDAGKVVASVLWGSSLRSLALITIAYKADISPSLSLLLPLQMTAYTISLDFWFYWYHRAMHEVPFLWKFHKTHHLTKAPNVSLALFADEVQEIGDILLIPLLAYYSLKPTFLSLSFYDWWVCMMYVLNIEFGGHSGARVVATPPAAGFGLLELFGLELIIEDHDLHHRVGWKKSGNYGKQSRVWDSLFGSNLERIECKEANLDGSIVAL